MQRPANFPTERRGWGSTASAGAPLRNFSELASVEADLDEIASRSGEAPTGEPVDLTKMVPVACNPSEVFRNYNKGKGTPIRYRPAR